MFDERFSYKEEVTGSNPVAPTRVFQKYSKKKYKVTHIWPTFGRKTVRIRL